MIIDINTNKIKSDKRLLNMFVNTYFNNIQSVIGTIMKQYILNFGGIKKPKIIEITAAIIP